MITDVSQSNLSDVFNPDKGIVFKVPPYQREYAWGKYEREKLFDDIDENDRGYFLGLLICIHSTPDPHAPVQYQEVVDGQQRLISLSLLLAAIYKVLTNIQEDFTNSFYELETLKRRIVLSSANESRVIPQNQNGNQTDYFTVLSNFGLIQVDEVLNNFGNRRISQTFEYFRNRILCLNINQIIELLRKLEATCIVKIQVANWADAYTLFNSLNNRGLPLTIVDVIKNTLLAQIDRQNLDLNVNYRQWSRLLENLQNDFRVQERFLRQFYNVFKPRYQNVVNENIATRKKILPIYEKLISHDVQLIFDHLVNAGKNYSIILSPTENEDIDDELKKKLVMLERIQAAPSYALLLYLFENKQNLQISDNELSEIVDYLVKFFVRRHLTDTPPTRDLDRIFMQIANDLENPQESIFEFIRKQLTSMLAPDEEFHNKLSGSIYFDNYAVARFILCTLEEELYINDENYKDLWMQKNNNYVWTIEHIFPQGENIPSDWINMIADGEPTDAVRYQELYVHKLGNLTITRYNPQLSNMSFERKRDRKDDKGLYIGYRNELGLNNDLKSETEWTINKIDTRTENLVEQCKSLFNLPGIG